MAKAHTEEDAGRIITLWHKGIGPTDLHDALGWTREEYARWVETNELPAPPPDKIIGMEWGDSLKYKNIHVIRTRPSPDPIPFRWRILPATRMSWHISRVPGQDRWIVRDTSSGIARLAPAPNDFHSDAAAQRRADQLNEKETT